MSGNQPIVLDTTVVSNYATSDSLEWLAHSLPTILVPHAVREELVRGLDHGHTDLARATSFLDASNVSVRTPDTSTGNDRLDAGENAALSLADETNGVLATDDATARSVARRTGVPVTGSIGLLVRGIVRETLDVNSANDWLTCWIEERGYYAPVDRVEDALPDERNNER